MNNSIRDLQETIICQNWGTLKKVEYQFLRSDGEWEKQVREVYDRGDGATVLLYNRERKTVILTQQFRAPTYLNGNRDGMMIETCAGKMDEVDPEACIKREIEEETGYSIPHVQKIFTVFMSPGSVSEKIHFFVAEYALSMKVNQGGGKASEQENIEVLEMPFQKALLLMKEGHIKDAKTIMLLQHAQINLFS